MTKCARRLQVLTTSTKMVLTRQCADVSKLTYHMRINVDVSAHDLPACFDALGDLRESLLVAVHLADSALASGRPRRGSWPAASCVVPWSPP